MKDMYADAEFYDIVNDGKINDIEFILKFAESVGSPVLELAAGTGRIAVPLLENGFQYTGIDLSPKFVDNANKRISRFSNLGEIVIGDMRNFDLDRTFNFIFLPFNSIFHLMDEDEIRSCLTCVYTHLNKTGKFLIDMFVPNLKYLNRDPEEYYPVGEYKDNAGKTVVVKEKNKYDTNTEINQITWYVFKDKTIEPEIYCFDHYMIPPERIQRLLKETGFTIDNIFSDYDQNQFNKDSKLQIYVCRKK